MSNFAVANVVWLFCGLVVLLFVQTYYLSLTTKIQATNPDNEKNCNKWIIDKPP